ncbi:MAG: hypothetical protein JO307_02390 [Bryobacterales bacterium]|nr:hypothetical protein [Bryobacterales bacterium]MBV9398559.1 hypothetical protein [Bryobacterales bacterium]
MEHAPEYTDTDPRVMEVWLDLLRHMDPGEKLAQSLNLTNMAFRLSEAGVRLAHPDADEREIFLRAAARRLPKDLIIRVYGWDPGDNGDAG